MFGPSRPLEGQTQETLDGQLVYMYLLYLVKEHAVLTNRSMCYPSCMEIIKSLPDISLQVINFCRFQWYPSFHYIRHCIRSVLCSITHLKSNDNVIGYRNDICVQEGKENYILEQVIANVRSSILFCHLTVTLTLLCTVVMNVSLGIYESGKTCL